MTGKNLWPEAHNICTTTQQLIAVAKLSVGSLSYTIPSSPLTNRYDIELTMKILQVLIFVGIITNHAFALEPQELNFSDPEGHSSKVSYSFLFGLTSSVDLANRFAQPLLYCLPERFNLTAKQLMSSFRPFAPRC